MRHVPVVKGRESEAQEGLFEAQGRTPEAAAPRDLQSLREEVHRTVHEISSPFQSIVCFLHLARCKLEEEDTELQRRIDDVISQSERINDLLRRIAALVDEAAKMHGSAGQVPLWQDRQLGLDLR